MTTYQLLNRSNRTLNASGVAILFFLLGTPSIYSALRQRSLFPSIGLKNLVWGLGLGIIGFTLAGSWTCLHAMA